MVQINQESPEDLESLIKRLRRPPGVPANMQLQAVDGNTHILIIITYRDNQITGVGSFRIYYLDQTLISASDLFTSVAIVIAGGRVTYTGFADVQGMRKYVTDIPNNGTSVSTVVSASSYTHGGWFYAVGVDTTGKESAFFATPVTNIPSSVVTGYLTGIPPDVTSQSVTLTHFNQGGEHLDRLDCTYNSPVPLGSFYGVTMFLENTYNLGLLEEIGFFRFKGDGPGTAGLATFNYTLDDGSNGPLPPPAAHNVTAYFVATNASGQHVLDPTTAPAFVLVGGII